MAVDTSMRPSELLNLKIKDIKFHVTEEGKQYAEVRIVEGKTGSRKVPFLIIVQLRKIGNIRIHFFVFCYLFILSI